MAAGADMASVSIHKTGGSLTQSAMLLCADSVNADYVWFAAPDMGITKGVEVYIRKVAPLGDPIEVTVRGYELSLRKADTEMIEVE